MVVLISSSVTICRVKPKLEDGSFRVSRLIPRPEVPFFSAVKKEQVVQSVERVKGTIFPKKAKNLIISEGRDEDEEYGKLICPGCGIFMQDNDPDLPGFYQKKKVIAKNLEDDEEDEDDELDGFEMVDDDYEEEEEEEEEGDDDEEDVEMDDEIKNAIEGSNSESESEFHCKSEYPDVSLLQASHFS